MADRQERNNIPDDSYDILQPIDISIFGTDEDPCFGKHYKLEAVECGRCGDSQICSIVCSQTMKQTRKNLEAKDDYKDIQTETKRIDLNLQEISHKILGILKKKGDQQVNKLVKFIRNNFDKNNSLESKEIVSALIRIIKDHPQMTSFVKEEKRYIKWKKPKKKRKK